VRRRFAGVRGVLGRAVGLNSGLEARIRVRTHRDGGP
jgi:hypothetical protein